MNEEAGSGAILSCPLGMVTNSPNRFSPNQRIIGRINGEFWTTELRKEIRQRVDWSWVPFGVRWQVWENGPTRDTALDWGGMRRQRIESLFFRLDPKRRRRACSRSAGALQSTWAALEFDL